MEYRGLVYDDDGEVYLINGYLQFCREVFWEDDCAPVGVITGTVGQLVGRDCDGTKIYDGDLVSYYGTCCLVIYGNSIWMIDMFGGQLKATEREIFCSHLSARWWGRAVRQESLQAYRILMNSLEEEHN